MFSFIPMIHYNLSNAVPKFLYGLELYVVLTVVTAKPLGEKVTESCIVCAEIALPTSHSSNPPPNRRPH